MVRGTVHQSHWLAHARIRARSTSLGLTDPHPATHDFWRDLTASRTGARGPQETADSSTVPARSTEPMTRAGGCTAFFRRSGLSRPAEVPVPERCRGKTRGRLRFSTRAPLRFCRPGPGAFRRVHVHSPASRGGTGRVPRTPGTSAAHRHQRAPGSRLSPWIQSGGPRRGARRGN
jgi:hypothetical protein